PIHGLSVYCLVFTRLTIAHSANGLPGFPVARSPSLMCRDCNLSSQLFSQSRTHRENGSPAPALELMGNRVSASMAVPVDRAVIPVVLPVFATGVYLFVTLLGSLQFLGIMPDLGNGRLDLHGIGLALVHHQGQLVTG